MRLVALSFLVFLAGCCLVSGCYTYYDAREVYLKNQVLAQGEVCGLYPQVTVERERLIWYKAEYANLRQAWPGKLFLGSRSYPEFCE